MRFADDMMAGWRRRAWQRAGWMVAAGLSALILGCGGGSGSSEAELTTACAATEVSWTVGTDTCQANVPRGRPNDRQDSSDSVLPVTGRSRFVCQAGTWTPVPAQSACTEAPTGTQVMTLSLTADPSGRWYDYFSDAFTEIGHLWNGSQTLDGFYRTDRRPDYVPVGSGVDHYPSEGNWSNLGSIFYDVTGYTNLGDWEAPITGISANLNPYVLGEQSVLNIPYSTDIPAGQVSGVVLLRDGIVVGVDFTSTIALSWRGTFAGDLVFTGPFNIGRDGRFTLTAGDVAAPGDLAARWEFSGTINLP